MINQTQNCPICYQEFDNQQNIPHIAKCGHSVCQICVKELKKKEQQHEIKHQCPMCRKPNVQWTLNIQFLDIINKKILFCGRCRYPLDKYFGMYYQINKNQNSCKFCYFSKKKNQNKIINFSLQNLKYQQNGKNYDLSCFQLTNKDIGGTIVPQIVFYQYYSKILQDYKMFKQIYQILDNLQSIIQEFFSFLPQLEKNLDKKQDLKLNQLKKVRFQQTIDQSLKLYNKFKTEVTLDQYEQQSKPSFLKYENFNKIMYNNKCFEKFVYNKLQRMSFNQKFFYLNDLMKSCLKFHLNLEISQQLITCYSEFKKFANLIIEFTRMNKNNYFYYRNPFNLIELNQFLL